MTAALRVGLLADAVDGGGGIGRYTREVLHGVAARDDVELTVIAPPESVEGLRARLPGVHAVVPAGGRGQVARAAWERYRLGRVVRRLGLDVVHGTKHLLPRTSLPTVLTVYDLMPITSRYQFPLAKRLLLPRAYRQSLREATILLAISETMRDRLVEIDPSLGRSTRVVPLGSSAELEHVVPTPLGGLDGERFALVVGDLAPRKNVGLLLDIWDEVHRRTGLKLVLVGPEGWRSDATRARLRALEPEGVVRWYGRVDEGELRWGYEHAAMLLFPTFEEGFGLPIVEALTFGLPVVASDDPALVEVAAGQALHLDPRDRIAWRDAIVDLATSERSTHVVRPPANLGSWDDVVEATVRAYGDAVRGERGGP